MLRFPFTEVKEESCGRRTTGYCPSCNMPFDRRRKRRLVDSCGHERCSSCITRTDFCPLCIQTGSSPPKMAKNLTNAPEPGKAQRRFPASLLLQRRKVDDITTTARPAATTAAKSAAKATVRQSGDLANTSKESGFWSSESDPPPAPPISSSRLAKSASQVSFVPGCISGLQEAGIMASSHRKDRSSDQSDSASQVSDKSSQRSDRSFRSSHKTASHVSFEDKVESVTWERSSFKTFDQRLINCSLDRRRQTEDSASVLSMGSKTLPKFSNGNKFLERNLKPLYFEVPTSYPVSQFTGRDWLFREIVEQLASNLPTNRGILITGGPGSGKTALILAMVERSCFGQLSVSRPTGLVRSKSSGSITQPPEDNLQILSRAIVAYHFCQADNATTCHVADFVHSISAQMSQAPQLAAYFQLIQSEAGLRSQLSVASCVSSPSESLVNGVLGPLKSLKKVGKVSGEICIIVIDGLCEAEQHRPDYGDSLATFLAKHLLKFPPWLKVVCTVRSNITEITTLMPFFRIGLDSTDTDERLSKDISTFIRRRVSSSKRIQGNINHKTFEADTLGKFSQFLANRTKGCFLYAKLILDLLESGQLVVKSGSYKVIPRTLAEIYQLMLNLRFSTSMAFDRVAEMFSVCLASLQSLTLAEVYRIVNALQLSPSLAWKEFRSRYHTVADLLVTRSDGSLMFFHPTFRDWLVKRPEGEGSKFLCDVRTGHAAIAFSMARWHRLVRSERVLDLCHHVLKSNLYKNRDTTESLPCRDLQASLVSLSAEDVSAALGCPRNIYSPVMKVSRLLLLSGASPDYTTQELEQAPLLAVYAHLGNIDMVSLLLEYSADTNRANNRGQAALHFAAREGHEQIVELLLHCGAKLNRVDNSGEGAIIAAARAGHLQVVELLLMSDGWEEEADRTNSAQQALVAAASRGQTQLVEFLATLPSIDPNSLDPLTGMTALAAAAEAGQKKVLHTLLHHNACANVPCADGLRPIHLGARQGEWEVVECLLREANTAIDIEDRDQRTALSWAAIGGHTGLVELLVDRGAALEARDSQGLTPLCYAVMHAHVEVAKCLLNCGASATTVDNLGRTILEHAVEVDSEELILALLNNGADMEREDQSGTKPLDRAIARGSQAAVSCFLKKGAKLSSCTWLTAEDRPEMQALLITKILEDGNTLFRKNQLEDAAHRYKYALRRIPRLEVEWSETFTRLETHLLLNLSRCLRRLGNFMEAEKFAAQVLVFDPENLEAILARSKASRAAGRKAEALALLESAREKLPASRELVRAVQKLREELEDEGSLVKISPFLGSVQSIPYMDDSSCRSGSSIAS